MLGVPSGASSVYRRVDPDGKELKLKARWAYPSRGPSPHAFLRDATPDKMAQSRWVLYLHGGGFNVCKTWTYLHVLRALAVRTGAFVVAPRYRRAPEHMHPAALDDCLATYRWLIRRGVPASRIVVFGDSFVVPFPAPVVFFCSCFSSLLPSFTFTVTQMDSMGNRASYPPFMASSLFDPH